MADYEPVGVREFREKLATYREPVKVFHTRGTLKELGEWYPADWLKKARSGPQAARPKGLEDG